MADVDKFPEMNEEFERLRRQWYENDDILFNLLDYTKYRETIFLRKGCVIRCIKANAVRYLNKNFARYHFFDEPYNLYSSLAIIPNMPRFSFALQEKRQQMDKFNEEFEDYVTGYDLLFDIDNPDLRLAYSTAFKLKAVLDSYHIPYWLIFSGTKGFHFRIDFADFPKWLQIKPVHELVEIFKQFAENVQNELNLPDLDTSIFDIRRIAKVPYSVVYPYYFVALPLSDEQFENFKLKYVTLPYLLNESGLNFHKRGVLKRTGNPDAFGNFVRAYVKNL